MKVITKYKSCSSLLTLILLGSIWGTGYSIARFAMTNGVPPLGYSFWQSVGPALIIGLLALFRHPSKPDLSFLRLRYYFICGLMGIALPNTIMYFAAPHLPAGILAMMVNVVPAIAYPLALLAGLEQFQWQRMAGIILALCGLAFIILPHSSLPSKNMVPWAIFTLITPFSFAICSIYMARYRPLQSTLISLTAGMLILSSFLLFPIVLFTHQFYVFHFPFTLPDWIIMLEMILSSIGYLLLFQLIKMAGPVYYSLVDTIVVLTGLFWGSIIFHEHLNRWTGSAVFMILFALLIVTQQQQQTRVLTEYRGGVE